MPDEGKTAENTGGAQKLSVYITPLGAIALSIGSAIGWGSFVVTGNSYLLKAGPLGSVLGILIGVVIMLIIGRNYHYLMVSHPDSGGAYTYVKEILGYDRAYLTGWFLLLAYLSVLWANMSALPLFVRYFIGDIFMTGPSYEIFGYTVYLGEVLLSAGALALSGLVCACFKKATQFVMIIMVAVFVLGIAVCFFVSFGKSGGFANSYEPLILSGKNPVMQVATVTCMSLWAFVGFENISHSSEEFAFKRKRTFGIIVSSIVVTALLYIFVILLSVMAYPDACDNWTDYISNIGQYSGIFRVAPLFSANKYMGAVGAGILMAAVLCLIITSLIGQMLAMSRFIYALGRDEVIPPPLAKLDGRGTPVRAIMLITGVSVLIPLAGRTAIGWIVDVTTISAALIYCFVSAAAYKAAKEDNSPLEKVTGVLGMIITILLCVMMQLINLLTDETMMEKESYMLFTVWGVIGFLFFRGVIKHDSKNRFGRSIIVWLFMLGIVLMTSMVWMNEASTDAAKERFDEIQEYYEDKSGISIDDEDEFIDAQISAMNREFLRNGVVVFGLFALCAWAIFINHSTMSQREEQSRTALGAAEEKAYRDQLTGVKSKHAFAEKEESYNNRIGLGMVDSFAVVVCDINNLKTINDTLGHKAGDEYIRAGCMMVCKVFTHSPVFRIGGDEFVATLEGDDYDNRFELIEGLNAQVEENNANGGVVVSVGLSEYQKGIDPSFHAVFERADGLMYARKKELKGIRD